MAKTDSAAEITRLLRDWSQGDAAALDQLMPLVYDELRQIAGRYMARQQADHTLQTTALIHEAYLRLARQPEKVWQNRSHFFAVASTAMRHILVDYARSRQLQKHGGGVRVVSLDEAPFVSDQRLAEVVALDEALTALAKFDARKCQVVEMRFFGGLSVEETAAVLNISPVTVMRDWGLAKAWLLRELSGRSDDGA